MYFCYIHETPVGPLLVAGDDAGLRHIAFGTAHFSSPEVQPQPDWEENPDKLSDPVRQLTAYFDGKLRTFELPLAPEGTDFQKRVWTALSRIPYGQTVSYGEVAKAIGNPAASRAVGLANGRNPLAVVVPCHRVIGSNGRLVGYGGGLDQKKTLLRLEGVSLQRERD